MKRNTLARNLFLIVAIGYFLLGILFLLVGVRNSDALLYAIAAVAFLLGVIHVYFVARRRKAG